MLTTLLLIDDEPRLRQLLARILQLEGYTVLEAENARAGLKLLERNQIHVIICDVKLPDGNGIELTARFKQAYPATEVIVLTAYGTILTGYWLSKMVRSTTSPRATTTTRSFL